MARWDGSRGKPVELDVSKKEYDAVEIGGPVEIGVRRGALEIPWVVKIRPAKRERIGHGFVPALLSFS